jgi:flagellar basal-body rod protein FlgB
MRAPVTDINGMNVTGGSFDFLARLLDAASLRHQVVAQNMANVNTPGYHALDVSFEDLFARRLAQGGETAAADVTGKVVQRAGGVERTDGNNVDVDAELGRLQKNGLLYNAYAQILATRIASMRSAISGH